MAISSRIVACICKPEEVDNIECGGRHQHLLHTAKDPFIIHYEGKHWSMMCLLNIVEKDACSKVIQAVHKEDEMRAKYINMRTAYEGESGKAEVRGINLSIAHDYLDKFGSHLDSCNLPKFAMSGRVPPKELRKCNCGYVEALSNLFDGIRQ